MASLVPGNSLSTACASTWAAVCLITGSASSVSWTDPSE